ncbi:LysR family transcriptional regulator [Vibrio sp. DW001]|uniref:LysR family transcriptional regulator n=1 Tax=Vibrio sp. DW001 TaxID=2912315 RepID=UPI0023AF11B8|nr:LysR family transcriptional regulator [Vibrio sp. DW001]WED25352.1 LysR family transcriptional regulator [Vibrio sp. DW001]
MIESGYSRLPSIIGLQTVVEIGRRGFTTAAARSLNLSQSAVSKQLIAVENLVGYPLFQRTSHGMIPTEAGYIYIEKASIAIKAMEDAALQVARINLQRKTLRVQVLPIFGDRWLLPRFSTFTDMYPDIEVQFTNFSNACQSEKPDAIFSFGTEPVSNNNSIYLFGKEALLVATPDYWIRNGSPKCFNDLLNCTFLEHGGTPFLWENFTSSVDTHKVRPDRVIRYGYYSMVIRAALSGQGIAFIPKGLVEEELQTGKLTSHPSLTFTGNAAYWYTPLREDLEQVLDVFKGWLLRSLENDKTPETESTNNE